MDDAVGPIDYGTTNMFVKQAVRRARNAYSMQAGLLPYQQVICVLADRIDTLEALLAKRGEATVTLPLEK